MAEVTNEMLYRELLALEQKVSEVQAHLDDILALSRLTAREAQQGLARFEATKARYGFDKLL